MSNRFWLKDDDEILIEKRKNGETFKEIAQTLGRSEESCSWRYYKLRNDAKKDKDPADKTVVKNNSLLDKPADIKNEEVQVVAPDILRKAIRVFAKSIEQAEDFGYMKITKVLYDYNAGDVKFEFMSENTAFTVSAKIAIK